MARTVASAASAFYDKARSGKGAKVAVGAANSPLFLLELLRLGFAVADGILDKIPDAGLRNTLESVLLTAGAGGAVGVVIGGAIGGAPGAAVGLVVGCAIGGISAGMYLTLSTSTSSDGLTQVSFVVKPTG